jgi:hypothetical protein
MAWPARRPGRACPSAAAGTENELESEVMMATAEECRKALEGLTARISDMDPDLGVTFFTHLGPDGADPVREAGEGDKPAQIRFIANSDVVVSISDDPGSFMRAWVTGRLKVQGSVFDLLRLRKLM